MCQIGISAVFLTPAVRVKVSDTVLAAYLPGKPSFTSEWRWGGGGEGGGILELDRGEMGGVEILGREGVRSWGERGVVGEAEARVRVMLGDRGWRIPFPWDTLEPDCPQTDGLSWP